MDQLRTTCDDNIVLSTSELGYTQSFKLVDTKLATGLISVAIAGLLFYVDKKYGFVATYNVTVASVCVYGALSLFYYYLAYHPQYKNNKFVGYADNGEKLLIAGWSKKHTPTYYVRLDLEKNGHLSTSEASIEFTKLFDGFGYYKQEAMTVFLKAEIEKLQNKHR